MINDHYKNQFQIDNHMNWTASQATSFDPKEESGIIAYDDLIPVLQNHFDILQNLYRTGDFHGFCQKCYTFSIVFHGKTTKYAKFAFDSHLLEFLLEVLVETREKNVGTAVISIISSILSLNNFDATSLCFQKEFFCLIDSNLDDDDILLVKSSIECIYSSLQSLSQMNNEELPFNLSMERLLDLLDKFDTLEEYILTLCSTVLSYYPNHYIRDQMIFLGWKIFNPALNPNIFFEALVSIFKANPEEIYEVFLSLDDFFVRLSTYTIVIEEDSEYKENLSYHSMHLFSSMISLLPIHELELLSYIPFEEMIKQLFKRNSDICKIESMNLLSLGIKTRSKLISLIFDDDREKEIENFIIDGSFKKREALLHLVTVIFQYAINEEKISMFYDKSFLDQLFWLFDSETYEYANLVIDCIIAMLHKADQVTREAMIEYLKTNEYYGQLESLSDDCMNSELQIKCAMLLHEIK